MRLVLFGGLKMVVIAVAVGLALAGAIGSLLSAVVYGVSPYDPLTDAAVTAIVVVAGVLACYVPARQTARIAPVELLRSEG